MNKMIWIGQGEWIGAGMMVSEDGYFILYGSASCSPFTPDRKPLGTCKKIKDAVAKCEQHKYGEEKW